MVWSIWACCSASMPPTAVEDFAVTAATAFLHPLAEIARLVACRAVDRLMRAGGGARRDAARPSSRPPHHVDLDADCRGCENFTHNNVDDGGHGASLEKA